MSLASTSTENLIDVRLIPPPQRHATIFQRFEQLPVGGWIDLLADHEPRPLQGQFQALWPDLFSWEVLQAGPDEWRIRISRRPAGKSCCGCCSGG